MNISCTDITSGNICREGIQYYASNDVLLLMLTGFIAGWAITYFIIKKSIEMGR